MQQHQDGSMKSITTKVEKGIPLKFSVVIPSSWRGDIMDGIKTSMDHKLRSALVQDLVVHMYSYGERPSKNFCSYAAQCLMLKYPTLRDACGTGYVSELESSFFL